MYSNCILYQEFLHKCTMLQNNYVHWCPKLKLQPVLSFSSFVHNSSKNEHKNMKLRHNICYEMIYWILYYWGFGSNLQMNTNDFFLKNYILKKEKTLMFFGKEIKRKVVTTMHYCQAEIGTSPKIIQQPEFFLWSLFSLGL